MQSVSTQHVPDVFGISQYPVVLIHLVISVGVDLPQAAACSGSSSSSVASTSPPSPSSSSAASAGSITSESTRSVAASPTTTGTQLLSPLCKAVLFQKLATS